MYTPGTKLAWAFLLIAVAFEILFAIGVKKSNGFTDPLGSVLTLLAIPGGLYFLSRSMRDIPLSIAYPIWTALGAIGAVAAGRFLFGEIISVPQFISVAAIIGAVAALRFYS